MSQPVGKLRIAYDLWRQYGAWNFGYRLYHAAARRAGLLERRFAATTWDARPLASWLADPRLASADWRARRLAAAPRFFFDPQSLPRLSEAWRQDATTKADEVLAGRLTYFSAQSAELGFPYDWLTNPFTGGRVDASRHWCGRNDFEADQGDIKFYWEASRFAWVYPLVRAYAASGDEKYAEAFWRQLDSWRAANPPNMGPQWQCGQECALRAMALVFGLHGLLTAQCTTSERVAQLIVLLALHAERIEGNIRFAQSQVGNHGLSEAVGLYTIGVLFPELARAAAWRRRGRRVIEWEARLHSYDDGSYVQHSFNYHRLMLHDFLWAVRLAELNGEDFAPRVRQVVERHCDFLYALQDEATGRVPNYGQNDGALILPVDGCPYLDYRPVVQATYYWLRRERVYDAGPWDEDLVWLFGDEALSAPRTTINRQSQAFAIGGYYTLRGEATWGMLRCHSYRHHPHQADMLHLDVWWRGVNVLRDSGSYSYNAPAPWTYYFVSTRAHNTVEVGGQSQMVKARRFTWVYLTRSQLQHFLPGCGPGLDYVQGEHYSYQRLASRAVHRRAVLRMGERYWLVVDDVLGQGREQIVLHWQLADFPHTATAGGARLDTPAGPVELAVAANTAELQVDVVRGQSSPSALGWESLHYGEKQPAPTLRCQVTAELPQRIVTLVALGVAGAPTLSLCGNSVHWADGGTPFSVELEQLGHTNGPLVRRVRLVGQTITLGNKSKLLMRAADRLESQSFGA